MNKKDLLQFIKIPVEAEALLGKPKNGKYHCHLNARHQNGDKDPSLTMSALGYYKCHACGTKGDIYQLYMEKHSLPPDKFPEVLAHFARKYNYSPGGKVEFSKRQDVKSKRKVMKPGDVKRTMLDPIFKLQDSGVARHVLDWLQYHYGVSATTAADYGLGFNDGSKRLFIPIPMRQVWEAKIAKKFAPIVNVRKHDIMRYMPSYWCRGDQAEDNYEEFKKRPPEVKRILEGDRAGEWDYAGWTPRWGARGGKVIGVKGHNGVYLYPATAIDREGEIWLVGGELKALMLRERGINACAMTAGENSWSGDILDMFSGRHVKVLYDIDEAGIRGATKIAKEIVDRGGTAEVGQIPPDGLPSNGDVTDFMRKNNWDIECLELITWTTIERDTSEPGPAPILGVHKANIEYRKIPFDDIGLGRNYGKYVEFSALLAGMGGKQYAVPCKVRASCQAGRVSQLPKCEQCALPKADFKSKNYPERLKLGSETVIDMTGLPKSKIREKIRWTLGIPKCNKPELDIDYATVEKMVIAPTVQIDDEVHYRLQQVYRIGLNTQPPEENDEYVMRGKVIGGVKDHSYTVAVVDTERVDGNASSFTYDQQMSDALHDAIWDGCETVQQALDTMIKDLGENVLYKFGIDTLIFVEMVSWFLPFKFRIGRYICDKVSPEVMIIGDTRVGKSSTAKLLRRHYGAGRYMDCGGRTTFVGLIGGNYDGGHGSTFSWGFIPQNDLKHACLDEAGKLGTDIWREMTNIRSDGIASRVTASGTRKTKARVRFLYLCNPKTGSLASYPSPLEAVVGILGEPQDMARLDLLYVIPTVRDHDHNKEYESTVPHRYTEEIARYHISWAWSLTEDKIKFASNAYVLHCATKLTEMVGRISLVAPSEAKFKVGRLAVGIAAMCYSYDPNTGGVLVRNEHVSMAASFLINLYMDYMKNAGVKSGVIPKSVIDLFDQVHDKSMLRILVTSDPWLENDFKEIFRDNAQKFKYEAQLVHNLMIRGNRFFKPVDGFRDLIQQYVNEYLQAEQSKANKKKKKGSKK